MSAALIADRPKLELYTELTLQLRSLIAGESDAVANMANTAALIFNSVPDINWAGFYLLQKDTLVLGAFQGRPACVRIPLGRGVCGQAAAERRTIRVEDVNEFDDHIACDSASRSEIVVPLFRTNGELIGVLDVDSPSAARFDHDDETGLTALAEVIAAKLDCGA